MKTTSFLTLCAATIAMPAIATAMPHGNLPNSASIPLIHVADTHDKMKVVKAGDLEIVAPMIRATPPNAPVSAGYMTIRNKGGETDRLIGGSAAFAGKVEIHEMTMDNDVMRMREIEGGLEIPPGGEVTLKAGGLHVMFMKLTEQMKEGETRTVTLEFEKAGPVEMDLPVMRVEHKH